MIIFLVAGITLGVVVGWAAHEYCFLKRKDNFRSHLKEKFTTRLQLNSEQQQQLDSMLDGWMARFLATRQRHVEDILQNMNTHCNEIRPILTPEQVKLLDALQAESTAKIREKMP